MTQNKSKLQMSSAGSGNGQTFTATEDVFSYTVEARLGNCPSSHWLITGTRGGAREPAFSFRVSPFCDRAELHAIMQEAVDRDRAALAAVGDWMAKGGGVDLPVDAFGKGSRA